MYISPIAHTFGGLAQFLYRPKFKPSYFDLLGCPTAQFLYRAKIRSILFRSINPPLSQMFDEQKRERKRICKLKNSRPSTWWQIVRLFNNTRSTILFTLTIFFFLQKLFFFILMWYKCNCWCRNYFRIYFFSCQLLLGLRDGIVEGLNAPKIFHLWVFLATLVVLTTLKRN